MSTTLSRHAIAAPIALLAGLAFSQGGGQLVLVTLAWLALAVMAVVLLSPRS